MSCGQFPAKPCRWGRFLTVGSHVFGPILPIYDRIFYLSPKFGVDLVFCEAHWAWLVCQISSEPHLQCEGRGLYKILFFGLNYSATIWLIGLTFLGKHLHIISSYWANIHVSSSFLLQHSLGLRHQRINQQCWGVVNYIKLLV